MLERLLPAVGFLFLVVYALASVVAFADGIEAWFGWRGDGWHAFAMAGVFIVLSFLRLTFLTLPLVFYGAWKVWAFTWWQAALFTVPALAIGAVFMFAGGIVALWEKMRCRR